MRGLSINKNEVLRYLGYKNQMLEKSIDLLIDQCINEIKGLADIRYVYKTFDIERIAGRINLKDSSIQLKGEDIYNHLKGSETCIFMAASLGSAVDTRIRYYEKIDMVKALILDACASTAVEEVCDNICEELEGAVKQQNKTLTSRYSPGYGDLPLEMQKDFISLLGADKAIGLAASSNSILIPRKSVTAIVGIVDKKFRKEEKSCFKCSSYSNCQFRRERVSCGA